MNYFFKEAFLVLHRCVQGEIFFTMGNRRFEDELGFGAI